MTQNLSAGPNSVKYEFAWESKDLPASVLTEFEKSAVPEVLTRANIEWVEGREAVALLTEHEVDGCQSVNYTTQPVAALLKRYEFAEAGGWVAYGCTLDGGKAEIPIFKPLTPRLDDRRDRLIKYERPKGLSSPPILPFIDAQTGRYLCDALGIRLKEGETIWQGILRSGAPIALTEGLKKALALIAQGIPAIALPSITIWRGNSSNSVHPVIEQFRSVPRTYWIAFDMEVEEEKRITVQVQASKLRSVLDQSPSNCRILTWEAAIGKGIDDAIYHVRSSRQDVRGWLNEVIKASEPETLIEVSDRDLERFKSLRERHTQFFDPDCYLPNTLASAILMDAEVLNIAPVSIWQHLMPAVASLMSNQAQLVVGEGYGGRGVAIIYSLVIGTSGDGKSRGDYVLSMLNQWEYEAHERYKLEKKDYDRQLAKAERQSRKDGADYEMPEKPVRRKYIINGSTPQGVTRRLSDCQTHGMLWYRPELKGLFASFHQFSKNSDGAETYLELWDGPDYISIDRANDDDCYALIRPRMSSVGGLQPDVVEQVFTDGNDSNGTLARMLPAMIDRQIVKRTKRDLFLPKMLPQFYAWIKAQPWATLTLDPEADAMFTEIMNEFGNMVSPTQLIGNWTSKAIGHTLRLAIILHVLDCLDAQHFTSTVSSDTLLRAWHLAHFYRGQIFLIQGLVGGNSTQTPTLLNVIVSHLQREGGKCSLADLYRDLPSLRKAAREENCKVAEFTKTLCETLQSQGFVSITRKGNSAIVTLTSSASS